MTNRASFLSVGAQGFLGWKSLVRGSFTLDNCENSFYLNHTIPQTNNYYNPLGLYLFLSASHHWQRDQLPTTTKTKLQWRIRCPLVSSWLKRQNQTLRRPLITWGIQGYYWLRCFFFYPLSVTILIHHHNTS